MNENGRNNLAWVRVGGICGLVGIVMYFSAAFISLPDFVSNLAAFSFGPLLAIGFVGLYYCLSIHKNSPLLQIGAVSAIGSGITVLIMITIQQSIFEVLGSAIKQTNTETSKDAYMMIFESLNSIHWGIDVAFDILISTATIAFSVSMLHHPKYGKIFGISGIILGSLLLGFNLYFFPTPPGSVNSIDWGPFTALWFTAAFVLLLFSRKWVSKQLIDNKY